MCWEMLFRSQASFSLWCPFEDSLFFTGGIPLIARLLAVILYLGVVKYLSYGMAVLYAINTMLHYCVAANAVFCQAGLTAPVCTGLLCGGGTGKLM